MKFRFNNKQIKLFVSCSLILLIYLGAMLKGSIEKKHKEFVLSSFKFTIGKVVKYSEMGNSGTPIVDYVYSVDGREYIRDFQTRSYYKYKVIDTSMSFIVMYSDSIHRKSLINLRKSYSHSELSSSNIIDSVYEQLARWELEYYFE
jgi:hypothetical protein